MIELTSIKITPNLQLRMISKNTPAKIKWSNEFNNTEKFEYLTLLTDSEVEISTLDWCIVTNPFDGDKYCEQCKKVTFENSRKIFYGIEGTRCLLCDVQKITATTNKAFISQDISPLSGEEIVSLLKQRKLKYSVPNFYNE